MSNDIKEKTIQEISKRNSETFNLVVREQNAKIAEQQKEINGLKNSISVLQERLTQQESFINIMRIKFAGNGPTKIV